MPRPRGPIHPESPFARSGARLLREKREILRLLRALDRAGVDPGEVEAVQIPLIRLAEVDDLLTSALDALERWGCDAPDPQEGPDPVPGLFPVAEEARAAVREALPAADQRAVVRALGEVVATDAEIWTQVDELHVRRTSNRAPDRAPADASHAPSAPPLVPLTEAELARIARRTWSPGPRRQRPQGQAEVHAFEARSLPGPAASLAAWFDRLPPPWLQGIARIHDLDPVGPTPLVARLVARLQDPAWLRRFLEERLGATEREELARLLFLERQPLGRRGDDLDERYEVPWDWTVDRPATAGGKLRAAGFAHVGVSRGHLVVAVPPTLLELLARALEEADPASADLPRVAVGEAIAEGLDGTPFEDPELDRWKRADREVSAVFEAWVGQALPSERAVAAFFGHGERELRSPVEHVAFFEFALFEWRESLDAPTTAERLFPTTTFPSDDQRVVAQATMAARPALYRVDRVRPGSGFDATPLFPAGEPVRIEERALSLTLARGAHLPMRAVAVGGFRFARVAGDPIARGQEGAVLGTLRRRLAGRTPEDLLAQEPAAFFRCVRMHR